MKPIPVALLLLILMSCGQSQPEKRQPIPPIAAGIQDFKQTPGALPVTPLQTIDGLADDSEAAKHKYPPFDTVPDIGPYRDSLAAYGASYRIWAGPKGWTGLGRYGADANVVVHLNPIGGPAEGGIHITYYEFPACLLCLEEAAAPYFPDAMEAYNRDYNADGKDPIKPSKALINKMNDKMITYNESNDSFVKQGVVYYESGTDDDPFCSGMDIVLPHGKEKLAGFFIKTYINRKQYLHKNVP